MTPSDGASIASKTLLGLIQAIPAEQTARDRARTEHPHHLRRAAQAGPGRGGSAGRRGRGPRRPRRHGAAQRPAEHRDVPRRVDGRHGGAAQPGLQGRGVHASTSRTPTPRCCCCRPRAPTTPGARPATRVPDSDGRDGRRRHRDAVGRHGGRTPCAAPRSTTSRSILHTSGSTGRPKRVPLTPRQPVDLGAATSRAATR